MTENAGQDDRQRLGTNPTSGDVGPEMALSTADLCDENDATVLRMPWISYGGRRSADGIVETARTGPSNRVLWEVLGTPGENRILLVDGGGMNCRDALVGDRLAGTALANGWQAIVVSGLVRDIDRLRELALGLWALGATPARGGEEEGYGTSGGELFIRGEVVVPGMRLVGDADGLIVLPVP